MNSLLTVAASIPALVLIFFVYKQDKKEKEPKSLLFKLVMFGFISIIPAIILEIIGGAVVGIFFDSDSVAYAFFECFFVIAVAEEGCKFLMLRLGSWKNRAFNFTFDGIVYAVCTSLGFALLENVMYVLSSGGFSLAVSRAFTAVMAHAVFGVLMGVYYGRARQYQSLGNIQKMRKNFFLAILIPGLLHGLYDFLLSVGNVVSILVFGVVLVVIYILMFVVVINASKHDAPAVPMYYVPARPVQAPPVQPYNMQPGMPAYQSQAQQMGAYGQQQVRSAPQPFYTTNQAYPKFAPASVQKINQAPSQVVVHNPLYGTYPGAINVTQAGMQASLEQARIQAAAAQAQMQANLNKNVADPAQMQANLNQNATAYPRMQTNMNQNQEG
ncbi:MAG: PrsW family glutamic-type intramembrane protease [Lachnospiraceae bacterium]|nr:PrsW family glutamic-type intramembrane protease [Lachnospiraceae bacterium]